MKETTLYEATETTEETAGKFGSAISLPDKETCVIVKISGKPYLLRPVPVSPEMPSDEEAGVIAVKISETVDPSLSPSEQAYFIAGFQECNKYLRTRCLAALKVDEPTVEIIKARIKTEYEKHPQLDWMDIAARKIAAALKGKEDEVEFWKNENSKTGNSYLNLLKQYNELKSSQSSEAIAFAKYIVNHAWVAEHHRGQNMEYEEHYNSPEFKEWIEKQKK